MTHRLRTLILIHYSLEVIQVQGLTHPLDEKGVIEVLQKRPLLLVGVPLEILTIHSDPIDWKMS